MKLIKIFITALLVVLSNVTYSQCNVQASICQPGTAGPFNFIPTGGAYAGGSFANAGCATGAGGNHAYGFITLYITQSGPLNLLINGNATTGFIDVAIFNIPPGQDPCVAIQNGANAIGCGFAQNAGGCIQFGNAFGCNSSFPAPNVVAGQQIMIIAQNWSNPGSSTFTLQLGPPPGAQTGPPNTTINPVGPFCTTSPNIQLTAANGGGTWTGPGVSSTGLFNPSLAGAGTHTITYSLGTAPCNSSSTTTITVNPTITPTFNSVGPYCAGSTIPALPTTSTNGINGTWSPAINNTTTTTYTFTPAAGQCANTATMTITINPPPTLNLIVNNVTCFGDCNGTIDAGFYSGATYTWSPGGQTTQVINNLCPGSYTVTVNQNGCQSTGTGVITQPPQVTLGNISHN
jgi:trimeric autotransporter adhesin